MPEAPDDRQQEEISVAREAARAMVIYAESAVDRKMKALMAFDARLSELRALKTPAAQRALAGLTQDRQRADDEVRALVELAGRCSALADRVETLAASRDSAPGALDEIKSRAERAEADVEALTRTKDELSQRAGDLMRQLADRDRRVAELEAELKKLAEQLQASPPAEPPPVPADGSSEGEALPDEGELGANPLIASTPKLKDEKYAGRASVRLRELLVEEPHHLDDLVDLTGLPRHEVIDCVESFVALGVARIVER